MIDLSNQVALVTGGSRGIGAATAILLAKAGADVAITYARDKHSADRVLKRIREYDRKGTLVRTRVEKPDECKNVVSKTMNAFERIDILINCAGIWEFGPLETLTDRDWMRSIAVNLTGTFNMCRAVVPIVKKQRYGRIINISSTAGQRGERDHSHYAASKGGIIAFTKSLAVELTRSGIGVNCVAPGWVDTDMVAKVMNNRREKRKIVHSIPRGRVATAQEIAGPVVFLASHFADHIIGEVLNVNGGTLLCS